MQDDWQRLHRDLTGADHTSRAAALTRLSTEVLGRVPASDRAQMWATLLSQLMDIAQVSSWRTHLKEAVTRLIDASVSPNQVDLKPVLKNLAEGEDLWGLSAGIELLVNLANPTYAGVVEPLLHHADAGVQDAAAVALEALFPQEARDALVASAWRAREQSYSPYSEFPVGAALLANEGQVFTGTNVECASFGNTICAERSAVVSAVSQGVRGFAAVAVVAESPTPTAPCGACRQFLAEFSPHIYIIFANQEHAYSSNLKTLLPAMFDAHQLPKHDAENVRLEIEKHLT